MHLPRIFSLALPTIYRTNELLFIARAMISPIVVSRLFLPSTPDHARSPAPTLMHTNSAPFSSYRVLHISAMHLHSISRTISIDNPLSTLALYTRAMRTRAHETRPPANTKSVATVIY